MRDRSLGDGTPGRGEGRLLLGVRRRGERGAVAVETALLAPLFILMIFGMVEMSFLMRDWIAINSATRAGARAASALPNYENPNAPPAWLGAERAAEQVRRQVVDLPPGTVQELWVYRATTDSPPASCAAQCVRFTWSGTGGAGQFSYAGGDWAPGQQVTCPLDPDAVGVLLRIQHRSWTYVLPGTLDLEEHTAMNLEPSVDSGSCG